MIDKTENTDTASVAAKDEKPDMASFDLRSLIAERKANRDRPIRRHRLCLRPSLVEDLRELVERYDEVKPDEDDTPKRSSYADRPEHLDLLDQINAKRDEIAAATVVVVLKGLKQDEYEQLILDHQESNQLEVDPIILEKGFDHWERDGRRIDGDRQDFLDLLPDLSRGEVAAMARKVGAATEDGVDVPFFEKPSPSRRR